MQFDAVYSNRVLVAIGLQHSIYEVTLETNGIGLFGNIINLCDYPEAAHNVTHLDLYANVIITYAHCNC